MAWYGYCQSNQGTPGKEPVQYIWNHPSVPAAPSLYCLFLRAAAPLVTQAAAAAATALAAAVPLLARDKSRSQAVRGQYWYRAHTLSGSSSNAQDCVYTRGWVAQDTASCTSWKRAQWRRPTQIKGGVNWVDLEAAVDINIVKLGDLHLSAQLLRLGFADRCYQFSGLLVHETFKTVLCL